MGEGFIATNDKGNWGEQKCASGGNRKNMNEDRNGFGGSLRCKTFGKKKKEVGETHSQKNPTQGLNWPGGGASATRTYLVKRKKSQVIFPEEKTIVHPTEKKRKEKGSTPWLVQRPSSTKDGTVS